MSSPLEVLDGTQLVYWNDISSVIKGIDFEFYRLVEQVSPGKDHPMYVSSYKYGDLIGDEKTPFLPNDDGELYRLGSPETPNNIMKNLGYGATSLPFTMTLDKQFEWKIIYSNQKSMLPLYVENPGHFIGVRRLIKSGVSSFNYLSNSILTASAGASSVFMLPNIGKSRQHHKIQRALGIYEAAPKKIDQHWDLFKEITRASGESKWRARLLYFSESWVDSIRECPEWLRVKLYLIEKYMRRSQHEQNSLFFDLAFSRSQSEMNIKSNPYLNETVKHLFGIACGAKLGFKPCGDDSSLPYKLIQDVYHQIYKIYHTPTILVPAKFDFSNKSPDPVYYSLQSPVVCTFSKKSENDSSAISDLEEIYMILRKHIDDFANKKNYDYQGSLIEKVSKEVQFSLYHYQSQDKRFIFSSKHVIEEDYRFMGSDKRFQGLLFASDSKFFRGCIKISK